MSFTISPLASDPGFGALVTGLDPGDISDQQTRKELYELWIDRGVIVFRGLPDDSEVQIELSRVFGEPAIHPFKNISEQGDIQELTDIAYRPERGDIVRIGDGPRLGAWLPWHFDLVYFDHINHGGILRAKKSPEEGGMTGFIDGMEAYGRLPDALSREIEDLYVVYQFRGNVAEIRYGRKPGIVLERMNAGALEIMANLDKYPPVAHPLVFVQQETGRKVLNFSPWFSLGIEGMDQENSDRILNQVADVLIDESKAYFHEWRQGDMVLWDNWRMLHCSTGIPEYQTRHMQRTTIAGDYGLGRRSEWLEHLGPAE